MTLLEPLWSQAGVQSEYMAAMRLAPLLKSTTWNNPLASLPGLCCEVLGGKKEQAASLALVLNLVCAASSLLDDIEDGDLNKELWADLKIGPKGSRLGEGIAANVSTGLIFSANLALSGLEQYANRAALPIRREFYHTMLQMCAGQHTDLTSFEPSLQQCWQIASAKSGLPFSWACWAGARLMSEDETSLNDFREFGQQLGMIIQIRDDIADLWPNQGQNSDLTTGRWTLPVAVAMSVMPQEGRDRLRHVLQLAPTEPAAEAAAREIIFESGAVLYLTIEVTRRCRRAKALLYKLPASPARDTLLTILEKTALLDQLCNPSNA